MKRAKRKRTPAQIAADKKRTGRPPLGREARLSVVLIRITAKERAAWLKAAKAAGMALGPWLVKPRRDQMTEGGYNG